MQLKCLILAACLLSSPVWASQEVAGRASVVDGDTLTVNQTRIRLWGIDAPESAQQCNTTSGKSWPCGRRAANALAEYLDGKTVRCQQRDVDRYGRSVAECFVQGRSINAWMVRSGWAVAYTDYSRRYVDDEAWAKKSRANLWQGTFQQPSEYRKAKRNGNRVNSSAQAPPKDGCVIKGNISSAGKIYHLPGQRDYERTRIDSKRGEKFFCSESQARKAGWRAAER